MSQYIPDITERFPEGFGGVDLTDTYFGGSAHYPNGYDYEPTEEEIAEEERKQKEYQQKIADANGIPSADCIEFYENAKANEPKKQTDEANYIKSYYEIRDYWSSYNTSAREFLEKKYCVEFSENYPEAKGKFAIGVEYTDFCQIKTVYINNLDYETFCNIYRDAYAMHLSPKMYFRYTEKGNRYSDMRILSNCSLGELIICDHINEWK